MPSTVKVLAALSLVASLFVLAPPAAASHRPNSFCSESGDVCQSSDEVDGVRKLRITLAAKYFSRYKLCVVAPDDSRTCHSYQIEKRGTVFGDSVRWDTHFPEAGNGAYTVIWKSSGTRIGRKLGFHI
jgi:hypothetical protein